MSTSDFGSAGLPKSPELHGVDASRFAGAATPAAPAAGSGWPSTEQVAAWANEFFRAADGVKGAEPALPTVPGTVSGFAAPDPASLGRRGSGELPIQPPTVPLFTSAAPPAALVSDPHFGQQLDYRPEVLQSTFVGSPTLGGVDPTGRGTLMPQPQPLGREAIARIGPVASPTVPYYFMNEARAPRLDPSSFDPGKSQSQSYVPGEYADTRLASYADPHAYTYQAPKGHASQSSDPRGFTYQAPNAANGGGNNNRDTDPRAFTYHAPNTPSSSQGGPARDTDPHAFTYQAPNAPNSRTDRGLGLESLTGDPVYLSGHSPLSSPTSTAVRGVPALESHGARHTARQNDESVRNAVRHRPFEVESVRRDFPILSEHVNGKPLVWLDNAATTQKPQAVIDRLAFFYAHENSNIHRAAHGLAARATDAYEDARETVRRFLNAGSPEEIIFVRGTTEGINLIANSWGGRFLEPGDEIIVSRIEHHSNIIPWRLLCDRTGANLRVAEVDDTGQIRLDYYERLFNSKTRLVSFTHVSNALGTILPVKAMTDIAHRHGARVVIDGAQSVCHMPVDVQALDCDFYVFSGHKVFAPTGIGAVYGKKALLNAMPPWQGGGSMIADVTFEKQVYNAPPTRFEAGTGNIADAVGLATALEYLEALGLENVYRHEHELLEYGTAKLLEVPGLRLVGTAQEKAAVMGFVLDNVPVDQVGAALSAKGIAVRSGHHCAQPALRRFGYEATVRPSLALYNNRADIDTLVGTLHDLQSRWLR
ncbi:MAG: family 2A encapsulin nanocompartment cargo protein cysteine desulfurase [Polyangiales bacterium]